MLETLDLNATLGKAEFKDAMATLALQLAKQQRALRSADVPVLIVFEGWDAAGKGLVLGQLLQAFDPRGFNVHNVVAPTEAERLFPPMARFWDMTPSDGAIAVYNHSWYRQVLNERAENDIEGEDLARAFNRIRVFERQLIDDGALIAKFFLHISKKEQAKRFKKLRQDPAYAWKVGKAERKRHKRYKDYLAMTEEMLAETSTAYAPWTIVPATSDRLAVVTVAETLAALFEGASRTAATEKVDASVTTVAGRRTDPLDRVDLEQALDKKDYNKELAELQREIRRLQHLCYVHRRAVAIVYEGWDAAGKGGNIRRLVQEMDPRGYRVVPVAAPQGAEKAHHYLWRFWRGLPKGGHFAIFDRSWYGRLLVERVEGFATPEQWQRAYREINEFEQQLVEDGVVVIKFWIHISKEEQLQRFEARQQTPEKEWKITDEDWRNREKWDDYRAAVAEMIERTSTVHAPWTIVEGNDKRFARIRALRVTVDQVGAALDDS